MTLYDTLVRLLNSGRITLLDGDRIVPVGDPASVNRDRTIQFPCDDSGSFAEAHSLAMEQMTQLTEIQIALCIIDDPLCPELSDDPRRGDPTIQVPYDSLNPSSADFSLSDELLSAPLDNARADRLQTWIEGRQREEAVRRESFLAVCNRQMESLRGASPLQQKCRTCTYRNKGFDRPVAREHLNDLKCGINPTYAMTGAGECADFVEEPSAPTLGESSVAQPPFDNIRVTGNCPFRISPALKRLLSPSSTGQYYCYRKLSYPSVSSLSVPLTLEQLSTEITIPVECIELFVDGEPSGFYVKTISGDDWSITGEPFWPDVHRITELPPSETQVNLGQLLINAIQAMPRVVSGRVEVERFPDGWGYEIRVRTNDHRPLAYRIAPNQFNPVTVIMAIDFFREKILENR
jgi:hypothetical protein